VRDQWRADSQAATIPEDVRDVLQKHEDRLTAQGAKSFASQNKKGGWRIRSDGLTYRVNVEKGTLHVNEVPYADPVRFAEMLGNPNLALFLSAVLAMWMLTSHKHLSMKELGSTLQPAIASAGVIILITAAGGAFGGMLKEAGVGDEIQRRFSDSAQQANLVWLFLAFAIAAVFKIAQGSGTVSIVTTASMMAAMLPETQDLGYHPVYVVMALGCGSKIGSWMNDSGFWVVCQMSGFTEVETLKTWTVLLVVMGVIGFATTLLLAVVMPNGLPFLATAATG